MNGALCYPQCKTGYVGNGPVCWESCPEGKHDCGALCTDSSDQCTDTIKDVVSNVASIITSIANATEGGSISVTELLKEIGSTAVDLAAGICDLPSSTLQNPILNFE
jgi:hypothetical protein